MIILPRLEVVVQQQNPDRFSPHAGHHFPLDRLLGDQSHSPTCLTYWRTAAHHGDDALLLIGVQNLCGARTLLFIGRRPGRPADSDGDLPELPVGSTAPLWNLGRNRML